MGLGGCSSRDDDVRGVALRLAGSLERSAVGSDFDLQQLAGWLTCIPQRSAASECRRPQKRKTCLQSDGQGSSSCSAVFEECVVGLLHLAHL